MIVSKRLFCENLVFFIREKSRILKKTYILKVHRQYEKYPHNLLVKTSQKSFLNTPTSKLIPKK